MLIVLWSALQWVEKNNKFIDLLVNIQFVFDHLDKLYYIKKIIKIRKININIIIRILKLIPCFIHNLK
jgi:hypothetical protein